MQLAYSEIVTQSDGKLIVVGHTFGVDREGILTRINVNGTTDTLFGSAGSVTFSIGTSGDDIHYGSAIASDDSVIIVGATYDTAAQFNQYAIRYLNTANNSESLDLNFGSSGYATTSIGTGDDVAFAGAKYGGITWVAGRTYNGTNQDFLLLRFDSNGAVVSGLSADVSFGTDAGYSFFDLGSGSAYYAIQALDDSSYGVTGVVDRGSTPDVVIGRYTNGGVGHTGFDTDGIVTLDVGGNADSGNGLALQTDSKFVIVGETYNGSDWDVFLARLGTDGSLDNSFETDGIVITDVGGTDNFGLGISIDGFDRLVIVGSQDTGTKASILVSRYTTNGNLDSAFDSDGIALVSLGANYEDYGYSVAVQTDSRVVVSGKSFSTNGNDLLIARLLTNGMLDNGFDSDRILTVAIDSGANIATDLEVQDDATILVVARDEGPQPLNIILRIESDGSLDTDWSGDGIASFPFNTGSSMIYDIKQSISGKIYVAGVGQSGGASGMSLQRLTSSGEVDASFGDSGAASFDFGTYDGVIFDMHITDSGQIVVVGTGYDGAEDDALIGRLWP